MNQIQLKEEIKKLKEELDYLKTRSFELPDDKSINSNNLQYNLRINKIEFSENVMDNSVNLGENNLNPSEEKDIFNRENLKIKSYNDFLKSENMKLRSELEKHFNKENEIINKLSKAVYLFFNFK